MESLENRIQIAEELWSKGSSAESTEEYHLAYKFYTEAHDTIIDCAKLHKRSHENLRRINLKIGNYGELITDWLLHVFAPLGVFEVVSYFSKTEAFGSMLCKRDV